MNSINIIKPYKYLDMWVFDDEKLGLLQEPFISGADTLIDKATESIPNAENGFILIFSKDYIPDTDICLEWRRADNAGNWYYSKEFNIEGWLCPALLKYFPNAPKNLYVKVKAI